MENLPVVFDDKMLVLLNKSIGMTQLRASVGMKRGFNR